MTSNIRRDLRVNILHTTQDMPHKDPHIPAATLHQNDRHDLLKRPQRSNLEENPQPDDLIGKRIGKYTLLSRIGSGAQAVVYRAQRDGDGLVVALKVLSAEATADADFLARFRREAKIAQRLSHPNIISIYDYGIQGDINYLVMELADGPNMEEIIDRGGPMAWRTAADLFLQIGQALIHLRQHRIVHRDIKPANIIMTHVGSVKIIDLGFAKRTAGSAGQSSAELTISRMSLGSPGYMAPEQVIDARKATSAADIYSLGASFFHALTGHPPFRGSSVPVIMQSVLDDKPPEVISIVPSMPPAISALIDWTLQKDPLERPESPEIFVRELENALYKPESESRIDQLRHRYANVVTITCICLSAIILIIVILRQFSTS